MGKYILVFKARDLTYRQANILQAESAIRAKQIAPASRKITAIENKGGNNK